MTIIYMSFFILQPSDWYYVTAHDIRRVGGGRLLAQYPQPRLPELLKASYPNVAWENSKFKEQRKQRDRNARLHNFFTKVAEELKITQV